jgi:hypothetical protein
MFIKSQVTTPSILVSILRKFFQSLETAAISRLVINKTQLQKMAHEQRTVGWIERCRHAKHSLWWISLSVYSGATKRAGWLFIKELERSIERL